jgi:hypothetical protein
MIEKRKQLLRFAYPASQQARQRLSAARDRLCKKRRSDVAAARAMPFRIGGHHRRTGNNWN